MKYTFFWKHKISQWTYAKFKDENRIEYNCCEQYMMYQKAKLFGDIETANNILKLKIPSDQKAMGRQVKNFNQQIWDKEKEKIVYKGNYLRFSQNKNDREVLLSTKGILVEASPYDNVWGIGLSKEDPRAQNENTWKGKNLLGKILTKLRNDFENKI